eukprot:XP_016658825.1 PREDICTED: death-associated inhibitor of apoptosis 1-like [Acyrthosiphon pisum]
MNFQKTSGDYSSLVSLVRNQANQTYPQYTTFTSRLKTYNLFPSTIPQNKYVLSEFGFIYTANTRVQDIVECFSCGLVLHDWKKDDIPWIVKKVLRTYKINVPILRFLIYFTISVSIGFTL